MTLQGDQGGNGISQRVFAKAIPNPYFESDVNAYLILADPPVLIDCGLGTPESDQALAALLRDHGLAYEDIGRVILTHNHPDHSGLARMIQERSRAEILIHQSDWAGLAHLEEERDSHLEALFSQLHGWGVPQEATDALQGPMRTAMRLSRSVDCTPMQDGLTILIDDQELEVVHTPGHTDGSACLRLGRLLFTGDTLLDRYTPNVGAGELNSPGTLARYLSSLARLRKLTESVPEPLTALPGHGRPIADAPACIESIEQHHRQRLAAVERILSQEAPLSVYQVAGRLFGQLDGLHVILGASESAVHLDYLLEKGRAISCDGLYAPP